MSGVSNKQLRLAKWYLDHKTRLYKSLLGLLISVNIVFWGLAIYHFINYLLLTETHEQMLTELTKNKIDYLKFHEHFKPQDLAIIKSVFLAPNTSDQIKKYDFVAIIENPNKELLISLVEYYFSWDTGQTEVKETFILPGEKKYLTALGQEAGKKPIKVQFVFSDIKWQRVDSRKEVPDILSKMSIKEINLNYVMAEDRNLVIPKISFEIKNQSIYSFWQVNFIIILYQDSNIVGVNTLLAKQWKSNEQREMELMWPNIPSHTQIAVVPEINPFDQEIFMPAY